MTWQRATPGVLVLAALAVLLAVWGQGRRGPSSCPLLAADPHWLVGTGSATAASAGS